MQSWLWIGVLLSLILILRADPAQQDIIQAATSGDLKRVEEIAEANPEAVNSRNNRGFTPLIMSVVNGHGDITYYLIEHGANVNTVENDMWTPLMFAGYNGFTSIAVSLIAAGANPLLRNHRGDTAFDIARRRGHNSTANLIGEESVLYGITAGSLSEVLFYVRVGIDVNTRNSVGWTPLMLAVTEGNFEIAEEFINFEADVNAEERDGWTALIFAAHFGHEKIAELLVRHGAAIHHQTKNGKTAMKEAFARGHKEVVDLLASLGVERPTILPEDKIDAEEAIETKGIRNPSIWESQTSESDYDFNTLPSPKPTTIAEIPKPKKKWFFGLF